MLRAIVIVMLLCASASAQEPDARARAKAHFKQGKAFYDVGAFDDAVREYEEAYKLAPLPQLIYNEGLAWQKKGDARKAVAAYRRFLELQPDGVGSDEARQAIVQLTATIEQEDAETARRAQEEAAAARKRAEAASTEEERERTRKLATDAQRKADEAEAQRRRATEEAAAARRAEIEHAQSLVAESHVSGRGMRLTGIVLGSVGVVALVIGAYYGSQAADASDSISNATAWSHDLTVATQDGPTDQNLMYGFTIAGGAMVLTGAILYLAGRGEPERKPTGPVDVLGIAPAVGPDTAGLVVRGRF